MAGEASGAFRPPAAARDPRSRGEKTSRGKGVEWWWSSATLAVRMIRVSEVEAERVRRRIDEP